MNNRPKIIKNRDFKPINFWYLEIIAYFCIENLDSNKQYENEIN